MCLLQVCKIPNFNYMHVGQEIHIGAKDNHPNLPFFTDIPDHDVSKYVNNIASDKVASSLAQDETAHVVDAANSFSTAED